MLPGFDCSAKLKLVLQPRQFVPPRANCKLQPRCSWNTLRSNVSQFSSTLHGCSAVHLKAVALIRGRYARFVQSPSRGPDQKTLRGQLFRPIYPITVLRIYNLNGLHYRPV